MTRLVSWLFMLAVAASVCLGANRTPLVSGEATAYESRKEVQRVTLSAQQLQGLTRWLEQRQEWWGAHVTEPSSEPVVIALDLTRADGEIDHLDVVAAARGGNYMRLSLGPDTRWAYRSFAGILKTRSAQQSINESDLATLRQLVFQAKTS